MWFTPGSSSPSRVAYGRCWCWLVRDLQQPRGSSPSARPSVRVLAEPCACRSARQRGHGRPWWVSASPTLSQSTLSSEGAYGCCRNLRGTLAPPAGQRAPSRLHLPGNSRLVGQSADWKRLFQGQDFFKKQQMDIHL